MLPVFAERAGSAPAVESLDLGALSCRRSILFADDGHQHVLFEDRGGSIQLAVSGASLLAPVRLHSSILWSPAEMKERLNGLESLNSLRSTAALPSRFFPAEPRRRRLCTVLRALDGSIAGAPHRAIAAALFGEARVQFDWADPGDHLRDRVRRAIKRGRTLMNGGYRRLLA